MNPREEKSILGKSLYTGAGNAYGERMRYSNERSPAQEFNFEGGSQQSDTINGATLSRSHTIGELPGNTPQESITGHEDGAFAPETTGLAHASSHSNASSSESDSKKASIKEEIPVEEEEIPARGEENPAREEENAAFFERNPGETNAVTFVRALKFYTDRNKSHPDSWKNHLLENNSFFFPTVLIILAIISILGIFGLELFAYYASQDPTMFIYLFASIALIRSVFLRTYLNFTVLFCLLSSITVFLLSMLAPVAWYAWTFLYLIMGTFWFADERLKIGFIDTALLFLMTGSAVGLASFEDICPYFGNNLGLFCGLQGMIILFVTLNFGLVSYIKEVLEINITSNILKKTEGMVPMDASQARKVNDLNNSLKDLSRPMKLRSYFIQEIFMIVVILGVSILTGSWVFGMFMSTHKDIQFATLEQIRQHYVL
ncbi:uncharacterized protein NEMAJ01_0743 [Nematocida major]|uniref:uncharacterized protein n=1 Tax=Nematocida major TaxID=1912982 RepID=UPI0020084A14|nr:uncharacterized protein NEMAJ01_0743 [Nematocida major]KAH9385847.1 hypothetical protein NEMAJ01_0743 [Nematocida major]